MKGKLKGKNAYQTSYIYKKKKWGCNILGNKNSVNEKTIWNGVEHKQIK